MQQELHPSIHPFIHLLHIWPIVNRSWDWHYSYFMAPTAAADYDTKSEERTQVAKYNNYGFALFAPHKQAVLVC